MALVNRVSRLFKADFNAVLDRIEEPDVLLRQSIREMQEHLSGDEQQKRTVQLELRQIRQRESALQDVLEQIDGELDICFDAGKEDLARKLVRRKLEQQQRMQQVNLRQANLEQQLSDIEQRLQQNRQQLEAMQQKAEYLLDSVEPGSGDTDPLAHDEIGIHDSDVEVAFLKEQQRRAS